MAYYYSIPIEEMDEELESLRFYPVSLTFRNKPVKEWVYERKLPRSPNHFVRIYTGINRYGPSAGESRQAGKDAIRIQVIYRDTSIECLAHNGSNRFPEGMDNSKLTQVMMTLTESIKDGKYICVEGCYQVVGKEKVFLVRHVTSYDNLSDSQMSESQFNEFKELCEQHDTSPLELMKLDETLWSELYAPNTLKEAVMLYCLNPQNKQDLLHIGLVTSMGEGKDHLIDHVIAPLVPVGVAGSGKMSTIAGLFGAMSGDDLNAIELGPHYHHHESFLSFLLVKIFLTPQFSQYLIHLPTNEPLQHYPLQKPRAKCHQFQRNNKDREKYPLCPLPILSQYLLLA